MSAKKQIADIENTILLLEEKIEKLEEEQATMKQMISMQNALIDNLQLMVKMMAMTPSKHQVVHVGGDNDRDDSSIVVSNHQNAEKQHTLDVTDSVVQSRKLKHRMSRVF